MSESKLKKISAYVPKRVHDEIVKYSNENDISISQSIIAGLVAGFSIPETEIEGRGRKIIISSDQETKEKVLKLEQSFEEFSSSITSQVEQILSAVQSNKQTVNRNKVNHEQSTKANGLVKNQSIDKILNIPATEGLSNNQQLALSGVDTNLNPFSGRLLGLRLGVHKNTAGNQKKKSLDRFKAWSSKEDPDNIIWIPNPDEGKKGYLPSEDITENQLLKLQKWIAENT